MDSLTQMALGASVGYAVAGKEWGPKALLWGAVGGTIPDLDVFGNIFLDDLEGLAFHRGFTHSILFVLLGPLIMTWLFRFYYRYKLSKSKWITVLKWILISFALLIGLVYTGLTSFFLLGWIGMGICLAICLVTYWGLWPNRHDVLHSDPSGFKGAKTSFGLLYGFFFAVFITHVFIDVCTTYGTQIFYPFNLFRASFHNISVIDPLYTLPLLLGIAGIFKWNHKANTTGLILSSMYMAFTFFNLQLVKTDFREELAKEQIQYDRYMVSPSMMNNVIWNGIAETDSFYYLAMLRVYEGTITDLKRIKKDREGVSPEIMENGGDVLAWFSDGYYETRPIENGVAIKDLRFAVHYKDSIQTGMGFQLQKQKDGTYVVKEARDMEMEIGEYIGYFRGLVWGVNDKDED